MSDDGDEPQSLQIPFKSIPKAGISAGASPSANRTAAEASLAGSAYNNTTEIVKRDTTDSEGHHLQAAKNEDDLVKDLGSSNTVSATANLTTAKSSFKSSLLTTSGGSYCELGLSLHESH